MWVGGWVREKAVGREGGRDDGWREGPMDGGFVRQL